MQSALFPIDRFFPADQYKAACSENKALVPMYLIARNQSLESIKKVIKVNEEASRQWNCPHPKWQVTPLHVAVWIQRIDIIKYLLEEKKCDPSTRDALGLLPMNYAEAMGNEEIIQLMNTTIKIVYVSWSSFWEKLLRQPEVDAEVPLFTYVSDNEMTIEGNSANFNEITRGAVFTPSIFFRNRNALVEMLAKSLEDSAKYRLPTICYDLEEIIKLEKPDAVPLSLKKQGNAGWGVVASQNLEPFVPIVIYAGEGVAKAERERSAAGGDYLLVPFEAHRFRNLGGMINEGFPNCIVDQINHPSGIRYPVIVPLRPIAKGEEIFIDYMAEHSIKRMKRIEFNLDEARNFLKKGLLKICKDELLPSINLIGQNRGNIEQKMLRELTAAMVKVNYLFNTSSLIIQLVFEKTIQVRELKILASEEKYLPIFYHDSLRQRGFLEFAEAFETFEQLSQKMEWDVQAEIRDHLNNLSSEYHAETVAAAFGFIAIELKQQLGFGIDIPKEALGMMFRVFQTAIPIFEITSNCLHEQRDPTNKEMTELQKIAKGHPSLEGLYVALYAKANTDNYPKLKSFFEERKRSLDQPKSSESKFGILTRLMRSMAPNGIPPEFENFLSELETNPESQSAIINYLTQQQKIINKD